MCFEVLTPPPSLSHDYRRCPITWYQILMWDLKLVSYFCRYYNSYSWQSTSSVTNTWLYSVLILCLMWGLSPLISLALCFLLARIWNHTLRPACAYNGWFSSLMPYYFLLLFPQVRFHLQNPKYILKRIGELGSSYSNVRAVHTHICTTWFPIIVLSRLWRLTIV